MTPTGICLEVIDRDGRVSFPIYEAYGWERVNQVIEGTLAISQVAQIKILDINYTK